MQKKKAATTIGGLKEMGGMIKNDFVNGTWKIILAALLSSIITIAGASYVIGKNDANVESRLSRLEEQFKDANLSLKEIASTLNKQNAQYTNLQHQLDQIHDAASARWTSQDQQIFALQMQIANPTIQVPSVDDIIRNRSMP